jgi:DNA-directed RNA polymerase subunit RPC12/RpoP
MYRQWTEEEVAQLRHLYLSETAFEEIKVHFPKRSKDAIRQKASRLGLKRPILSHSLIDSRQVLKWTKGDGGKEEYIFKCSECGSWIHLSMEDNINESMIVCKQCSSVCKFVS